METAEDRPRFEFPTSDRHDDGAGPIRGRPVQRAMRVGCVVVADVFAQEPAEVPFAEHDDVVQTLVAKRANDALCDRVRLGRPDRCQDRPDPQLRRAGNELAPVTCVAVLK